MHLSFVHFDIEWKISVVVFLYSDIILFYLFFRYRNTYKHNLCVDMLQNGFHLSFCELFALIRKQEESRQQAGPESLAWSMTLLKDEHEKLDVLKQHLTRAETAQRKGNASGRQYVNHCFLLIFRI